MAFVENMLIQGTWERAVFGTAISVVVASVFCIGVWFFFKKSIVWKLHLYGQLIVLLAKTAERFGDLLGETTIGMSIRGWIVLFNYFLIAGIIVYFAKAHIAKPIIKLRDASDKVTSGEFDFELPKVKDKNEIKDLTASVEMLISALKARLTPSKKNK